MIRVLLVLFLFLGACSGPILPTPEAFSVLKALAGAPSGPAAHRDVISYGPHTADLYHPPSGAPRAGIVLVPGAAEGGHEDTRLVALANALARVQFAVLVPDIVALRHLQARPSDVDDIAEGFRYLRSHPELAPGGRVGLGGISYAGSVAFLVAARPELRDQVRFVITVGAYHDLTHVITYFTTGQFQEDGQWRHVTPSEYGKWIFVLSNLTYLPDASDRVALQTLAHHKLADPKAPVPLPPLHPPGQVLWALLTNPDPTRVPALLAAVPAPMRRDIAALDLANKDLSGIRAHAIVVHGRDDDIIPYTESVALAHALPPERTHLYVVGGLFHVNLRHVRLLDTWRLGRAIQELLAERSP